MPRALSSSNPAAGGKKAAPRAVPAGLAAGGQVIFWAPGFPSPEQNRAFASLEVVVVQPTPSPGTKQLKSEQTLAITSIFCNH